MNSLQQIQLDSRRRIHKNDQSVARLLTFMSSATRIRQSRQGGYALPILHKNVFLDWVIIILAGATKATMATKN